MTNFAVRVAGLPVSVLDDLRCRRAYRILRDIRELDARLAAEDAALADELYEMIGRGSHPRLKPQLVGVRRALFRHRRIPGGRARVLDLMPPDLRDRVRERERGLAERAGLLAELNEVLQRDKAESNERLREIVASPEIRTGLIHAAPELHERVTSWLDRPDKSPQERRLVSLAKYVVRATAKTSPLSTFTTSGLGRWTDGGPAVSILPAVPARCVFELQPFLTQAIVRRLLRSPACSDAVRVRINPSAVFADGVVRFLGPPPDGSVVALRLTPRLQRSLEGVGPGVPPGADRVFEQLVEIGLLEHYFPVPDQSADYLGDLLAVLEKTGGGPDDLLADLRGVHGEVREQLGTAAPERRARRVAALRERLVDVVQRAGATAPAGPDWRTPLFSELSVFEEPIASCDLNRWGPVLDDLQRFRLLLPVFDRKLPFRLAMAAYFEQRHGTSARVPFVELFTDYQRELASPGGVPPEGALGAAELQRIREFTPLFTSDGGYGPLLAAPCPRVRDAAWLQLSAGRRLTGVHPGTDGVVRVPGSLVDEIVREVRGTVDAAAAISCYGQVTQSDPLHFVVNDVVGGHGRGRGLVRRLAGDDSAHSAVARDGDGRLLAEIDNTFGVTLNVRAPAVAHVIDYPGLVNGRPDERRIPIGELEVRYDADRHVLRLFWARAGREVRPVHTTTMWVNYLPPPLRLLIDIFADTPDLFRPNLVWPGEMAFDTPPGEMRHGPRVELGSLTLRRARWVGYARDVPQRRRGEGEAVFLLRLSEWLAEHGIPDACYVQVMPRSARSAGRTDARSRKPMYFDLANRFLVRALEQACADDGSLIGFHESWPGPQSALPVDGGERRVTEFLIEVTEERGHDA
ncbi:lantibiotic dehydratase [Actinomadura sp. 9N215]|uniref:lantibiotic dehydratase n=1 Tax=Actinomadura sp. 9N215 TaxID=3375150 RepID=UPI0037ABBB16